MDGQQQADRQRRRPYRERKRFRRTARTCAGIKFGWGDKIAPRVGFAYDIAGDGKWKAYGS